MKRKRSSKERRPFTHAPSTNECSKRHRCAAAVNNNHDGKRRHLTYDKTTATAFTK